MISDQELLGMIAEVLEVPLDQVTWEADLLIDLNADSLSLAHLAAVLEQKTGQSIPPDQLTDILTVGDLRKVMRDLER